MALRRGKQSEENLPQPKKRACDACAGCGLLRGGGIGDQAKVCKKCQGSGEMEFWTKPCHGLRLVR